MSPPRRYHKQRPTARPRCLEQERERRARDQARAQRARETVPQAIQALGPPETVAAEVHWRRQAPPPVLGKLFAMRLPPAFGCRS